MADAEVKGLDTAKAPKQRDTYEVLQDGIMVNIHQGTFRDRNGVEYEQTRSEASYKGDHYDNLSDVLIEKIEAGQLSDVFRKVDPSELAPVTADGAPVEPPKRDRIDVETASAPELAAEIEALRKDGATIEVVGTGTNGNVQKQDNQKALAAYYASQGE